MTSYKQYGMLLTTMKKVIKGIHRCWNCRKTKVCIYDADPYRSAIHDDLRPVWECEECREQSEDNI